MAASKFTVFKLAALIALGVVLCGLAVVIQRYWREIPLDVAVYWEAGQRMRLGGAELYEPPTDKNNGVGRFIYPPTFAVLFAPLTLLPRWAGYAAWGVIQLGVIALALHALAKLCRVDARQRTGFWLLLLLTVFGAAWETIREGQVNFIVLAVMAHGLWRVSAGRAFEGGIWLALAAHLKVIPGVLLAVLVVQRRWRAAMGMLVGLALFYFSPLVWTVPALGPSEGFERNQALARQYMDEVAGSRIRTQEATNVGGARAPNCALSAFSQRLFMDVRLGLANEDRGPLLFLADNRATRWGGFGLAALMYAAALLLAARRRDVLGFTAACGLAFLAATLGNVLCWPHHLAALGLVVGPLAALALERPALMPRLAVLAGVVVLCCFVALLPELELLQIWGVPTLGALAAWGVCFYTFWQRDERSAAASWQTP